MNLINSEENKVHTLELIIDGQTYNSNDQYKTGKELKQLAGIPENTELFLEINDPWCDELIENDTKVDLARPSIENFFVKKKLEFSINGVAFTWYKQYILGSEIRKLGNIDIEDNIFLKIDKPFLDEPISDNTRVDLAIPGKEHFISKEVAIESIIVNGREVVWLEGKISFEQVVQLAGFSCGNNDTAYTVNYTRGPKQNPAGSLVAGDIVKVKKKMNFNVSATNKS